MADKVFPTMPKDEKKCPEGFVSINGECKRKLKVDGKKVDGGGKGPKIGSANKGTVRG